MAPGSPHTLTHCTVGPFCLQSSQYCRLLWVCLHLRLLSMPLLHTSLRPFSNLYLDLCNLLQLGAACSSLWGNMSLAPCFLFPGSALNHWSPIMGTHDFGDLASQFFASCFSFIPPVQPSCPNHTCHWGLPRILTCMGELSTGGRGKCQSILLHRVSKFGVAGDCK